MQVIIGLGNPGFEYDGTRHNIGFAIVDAVSENLRINFRRDAGEYLIGTGKVGNELVTLVKPQTYMNNSGIAVREIVERLQLDVRNLMIVLDDFHLSLGTIRIREKGSDGGHNGLYSVIDQLGTNHFPRLRCGLATDTMPLNKKELVHFVLSPFAKEDRETVERMIGRAAEAILAAATDGLHSAMNRFNTR